MHGRGYVRVDATEGRLYGLPRGRTWWWCVLPLRRLRRRHYADAPRVGWRVGRYVIHSVAVGFERGGVVGIVGVR
jgi:hypothetical protein